MQSEYLQFKKLLEYYVTHLEWIENKDETIVGYDKYIKPYIDKGSFKITGQGYDGAAIQNQIKEWESYSCGKICINVQGNFGKYNSVKCYLNWETTGINVLARWDKNKIISLYQDEYIYWEKPTRRVYSGKEYSLERLKLFESDEISEELIDFFSTFKLRFETFQKNEKTEKLMSSIYKNRDLLKYKKQIILQGPPGTGKTREAKLIAKEMLGLDSVEDLKNHPQFKLIQFHPSYTYEDFVRGIVAQPNPDGEGILYRAENKLLALFAKEALNNYQLSQEDNSMAFQDNWINDSFNEFKGKIESLIGENDLILSGNIGIFKVENDCFRYGKDWQFSSRINFHDFKLLIKAVLNQQLNIQGNEIPKDISVHAHYRFTYYLSLLRNFFDEFTYKETKEKAPLRNYVLIIDEINRANLSSVLGELIYALEYRGEAVESMYNVDGNELILPSNLYIIGTMNTADRSVGHIDYAIRRRFAFADILPMNLKEKQGLENFNETLFMAVEKLFLEHTSPEFEAKDVQLGHSYFIDKSGEENGGGMDIRFEYEIKPILLEYVKDGVLIGNDIKNKIEDLYALA